MNNLTYRDYGVSMADLEFKPPATDIDPQDYEPTSIQYLANKENRRESTMGTFLLCRINSYKCAAHIDSTKNTIMDKYTKTPKSKPYTKSISVTCCYSSLGENTGYILIRTNQEADDLFRRNLPARDNKGGFSPGSMIVLLDPEIIHESFGKLDTGVPIVIPSGPLLLVDMERSRFGNGLMSIPGVTTSDRLTGFYFSHATVNLLKMKAVNTVCRGYLCDALDLTFSNKPNAEYCPCFVMKYQDGHTVLDLKLQIEVLDGSVDDTSNRIFIESFTSRVMSELLTKSFVNHGDKTLVINSGRSFRIFRLMKELIDLCNSKDGWNGGGWFRRGYVDDTGVEGKSKVKSAELNYHLTYLRYNGNLDGDEELTNITQRIYDLLNDAAREHVLQDRPANPVPEDARQELHIHHVNLAPVAARASAHADNRVAEDAQRAPAQPRADNHVEEDARQAPAQAHADNHAEVNAQRAPAQARVGDHPVVASRGTTQESSSPAKRKAPVAAKANKK